MRSDVRNATSHVTPNLETVQRPSPGTGESAPAKSRVQLFPIPGMDDLTFDGCVCSEPSYVFRDCSEKTYELLKERFRKSAAKSNRQIDQWPGVRFDDNSRTIEIRLAPLMGQRFLNQTIFAKRALNYQTGMQPVTRTKYEATIKGIANAWDEATRGLSRRRFDLAGMSGMQADKTVFCQMMSRMLDEGSVSLAESSHLDNHGLLNFLEQNMAVFKAKQVKTIYTEYLTTEICRSFAKADGSLDYERASSSSAFREEILSWPHGSAALKVFEEAHRNGIRIVGINSLKCYPVAMDDLDDDSSADVDETESDFQRQASMNWVALDTITNDVGSKDKFIVWAGGGHLQAHESHAGRTDVRGVNMALGIPSVYFSLGDAGEWGVFHVDAAGDVPPAVANEPFLLSSWTAGVWDAWVISSRQDSMKLDS